MNIIICIKYPLLTARFLRASGRLPSVALPTSYTDRLQWRKVFDHNPLFVTFSDKLATKDYIARLCPDLAIPRTLWHGTSIDDAPVEVLSGDVVVKANHGSTMNHFITGGRYDRAELRRLTQRWMATRYGASNAEWAYGLVERKLLAEERLAGVAGPLVEINIRAGRGRVALGSVLLHAKTARQSAVYFDPDLRRVSTLVGNGMDPEELERVAMPPCYAEAVRHALHMSRDVDYARYDFYWTGARLYAGEITPYPASGYSGQDAVDLAIGRFWDIRSSWFMTTPLTGWHARYREMLRQHLDRVHPVSFPG